MFPHIGTDFFANYETTKLSIAFATQNNLLILFLLLVLSILSIERRRTDLLDNDQVKQLKGLAILLIVVGHLWVHVSTKQAIPILGDYSVSLFLILSGFGLAMSARKNPLTLPHFANKRIKRVVIPYWIVTGLILTLDYFLLNKSYSFVSVFQTIAGLNVSQELRHLDYTRWYITLLLIYYVMFFLTFRYLDISRATLWISVFGVTLVFLQVLKVFPLGSIDQILAFPIGCVMARHHQNFFDLSHSKRKLLRLIILITLGLLITLTGFHLGNTGSHLLVKVLRKLIISANSLFFSFFLIAVVGTIGISGYLSRFLLFCGIISYEIYLIHGPILIKYNPVLNQFPSCLIAAGFILLLGIILCISYGFHVAVRSLQTRTTLR